MWNRLRRKIWKWRGADANSTQMVQEDKRSRRLRDEDEFWEYEIAKAQAEQAALDELWSCGKEVD